MLDSLIKALGGYTEDDLDRRGNLVAKEKDRKHWLMRYEMIATHIADVASCRTAREKNKSVVDVADKIINPLMNELLDMDDVNAYVEKTNGGA